MDTQKQVVIGVVGFVLVVGAAFMFLSGNDPSSGDGDAGDSAATGDQDCQTGGFADQPGDWAGITCQTASGAATMTDTWPCEKPQESVVGGTLANATSGTLAVTVEDAAGTVVLESRYEAGASPVGEAIGEGEPGEWTLTVAFSEDWESGEIGIGASCGNGSSSGGSDGESSGSEACQTTSNQESGGMAFGQIRCTDKQGADTFEATFDCQNPSQGNVGWDPDMDAGEVTLTVLDADGQTVVEETFNGTTQGGESLGSGATGEWTVRTELSADFEGGFYTQASCSTG